MFKKIIFISAIIFLFISSSYAVEVGGVDFNIPDRFSGGNELNSGYKFENKFSVYDISDEIPEMYGFWVLSADYRENLNITKHPCEYFYSYNTYSRDNLSHIVFASDNCIFMISWEGENITDEIKDMVSNTPDSKISDGDFHKILNDSVKVYKSERAEKLSQDAIYNQYEAELKSKQSQNDNHQWKDNRYLIYYYNRMHNS